MSDNEKPKVLRTDEDYDRYFAELWQRGVFKSKEEYEAAQAASREHRRSEREQYGSVADFVPADPNRFLGNETDIKIITLEEAQRRMREMREKLRREFGFPKEPTKGEHASANGDDT